MIIGLTRTILVDTISVYHNIKLLLIIRDVELSIGIIILLYVDI